MNNVAKMNFTKQQARELAPENYSYGGFWDNHYHYQTGDYKNGFYLMSVRDEDMTPENLAFMAKHGLTRIITAKDKR